MISLESKAILRIAKEETYFLEYIFKVFDKINFKELLYLLYKHNVFLTLYDKILPFVYLNSKSKELQKLLSNEKTMIIRGAAGKKCPLGGRAKVNDVIYFVETGGDMLVTHKGVISKVIESEKMTTEESIDFIKKYKKELNLSKDQYERWAGKKFLAVYEISNLEAIEPFKYEREKNMDDWIITEDINQIKL